VDTGWRYLIFSTRHGWMGCLSSPKGLVRVTLPRQTFPQALDALRGRVETEALWSPRAFSDLVGRFTTYFNGREVAFPYPLDFTGATPFQCRVWEAARAIPYGKTSSYGALARQIGQPGAMRAVGQAMGRNPVAIIVPCHRVIASDGSLGGFGHGPEMKRLLLRLERIALPR